ISGSLCRYDSYSKFTPSCMKKRLHNFHSFCIIQEIVFSVKIVYKETVFSVGMALQEIVFSVELKLRETVISGKFKDRNRF
ncbi:MAG: hypothetical protein LUF30_00335, partial [Lachnospiraceae bacterium]|nr:hypothetical protein [Lachnospiraceae bacterium]